MKYYLYFAFAFLILSCSANDDDSSSGPQQPLTGQFAVYDNVMEALTNHGAYSSHDGTLVSLYQDDEKIHVQVSPKVSNQSTLEIERLVKKTMVDAAFKAFAHTGLEAFQISVVPIDMTSNEPAFNYLTEFSTTAQIHRKTSLKILEKHLLLRDLKQLYTYDEAAEVWYSNNNLELLQSNFLAEVFAELIK